jgi:hypothetical protein
MAVRSTAKVKVSRVENINRIIGRIENGMAQAR